MASQHQQRSIKPVAQPTAALLMLRAITRARLLVMGIVLTHIAVAVLLISALTHPTFQPVDVGSAGDERFLAHFYEPETDGDMTYRWSDPAGRIVLHGTTGAPHVLSMRLFVPPPPTRPLTGHVQLVHGESVVADWVPTPGWHTYHVLLPAGATIGNGLEAAPLAIVTPLHRPGRGDQRDLGVALNWLHVRELAWSMPLTDPSVLRALALVWGFVLVTLVYWRADRIITSNNNGVGSLARSLLMSIVVGAALVLWARRAPAMLAWALPATPWFFGVLTVAAVGPTIARTSQSLSRLRVSPRWLGLGMLAVAQLLLWTQTAVLPGALLVVVGWLVGFALPSTTNTLTWSTEASQSLSRRAAFVMLAGLLILGAAFRFYQLANFPFGMWRDEARYGLVGLQMLQNPRSVPAFITESYVNLPALGLAPFAVAIKLFGIHVWSMRVATAVAGTLTLLPIYGIATLLSGRRAVGLLAAGLLAASSWQVMMSRLSFPAIFEPLCTLAALWFMLWSLREANDRKRTWLSLAAAVAAGACLGVAVQTYFSARLAPLTLGLFALLAGWRWHVPWRRWLMRMALLGAGALLVALPLIQYAIAHPDAFNSRVDTVFILTDALSHARAPLAELDESLGRHLLMFNAQGDMNGRHHAPGRPLLDLLSGFGLLVGCGVLWQTRRARQSQAVFAALLIGVLPSALAVDGPHAMRSISAAPWAYVVAALGWTAVWHIVSQQGLVTRQRSAWAAGALLLVLGVATFNAGLLRGMSTDPAVWQSFYPTHTQIGNYIRELADSDGPEAVSAIYVDDDLARNSVMQYLTYGLPVQTFFMDHLPQNQHLPLSARFILSGYNYQRDLPQLIQAYNLNPAPINYGPPLPGTTIPSFVIYGPRTQK
jgi:4-amino-4-deoxy-L-arabinose transferase-like glycosyltransferase